MGWDAPGHVPWENKLDYATRKWLPEGSLFSSESFSRGLFHARNWRSVIGSDFSRLDDMRLGDLNSEMIEMMRELQNLRSYFAETLRDDSELDFGLESSRRPPVPALVVSTSYMTIPLTSFESSQSLSPDSTSVIASRRGREPPPPLIIQKENSHHVIPTGSRPDTPGGPPAAMSGTENSDKPTLRVEDMISNLRLQCSHMSFTSLPVEDISLNSRSPMTLIPSNELENLDHSNTPSKQSPPESSVEPGDDNKKPASTTMFSTRSDSRLKGRPVQSKVNYKKRTSMDLSSSRPPLTRKSTKLSIVPNASPPARVIVQDTPPSAMAKVVKNRKPYQMVRFVLPKSEVEEDLLRQSLSTTETTDDLDSKVPLLPYEKPKAVPLSPPIRTSSLSVRKAGGDLEALPPRHSKVRTRSVNLPSFRKIGFARESVDLKTPRPESGGATHIRRAHTLTAHSFSRIIRRPVLSLRENKRATIAIDSTVFKANSNDDKKRMSAASVQVNSRKSRMPIHIKSLLTRFK